MEDAYGRTTAAVTSCWGRFGVAVLWRRLRRVTWPRRRYRTYVLGAGAGGLNYDPLSYSQNFDDGKVCECEPDFFARPSWVIELWPMACSRPGRRESPASMKSHGGGGAAAFFLALSRTSGGGEDAR